MRIHTNDFKNEIPLKGRQINSKIYHYFNFELANEDNDYIVAENGDILLSEQYDKNSKEIITEDLIYSMQIIKNGQLLRSLMKQFNFEAKIDLKIGDVVNPHFGLLVNGLYEYLNYGDYIIYSKKYNATDETWQYTCYDMMLRSMIQHTRLNISYPITVKEYIKAIADKMGIGFANYNENFINYNQLINKDYFIDKNVTFRDILDKLSETTASNILINDNNELEIGYVNDTNDIINKSNLKDINVDFADKFGAINKITIINNETKESYTAQNDISIEENGLTEISIIDNPIILNNNQQEMSQNILNKLDGLYYSINNFTTTGVCYYDFLDIFKVEIDENIYQCLLLNNEITITQGIEETIFTNRKENSKDESGNYENNNLSNKQIQQKMNQLNDTKVESKSLINSINDSKERAVISTEKIMYIKDFTGTTDTNGFLDIELNADFVVCSATASFNSNDYGFVIPYYDYNNGSPKWKLKIKDKNDVAVASTQIATTIYYFRKERND